MVFGRAKWTSIKAKVGLSARKFGLKAVQTRKTSAIFFQITISEFYVPSMPPLPPPAGVPVSLLDLRDTWALGGVEIGVRARCMSPSVKFASSPQCRHGSTTPPPPHLNTRTSAPWHSLRAASSPTRSPCPFWSPCKRQQSKRTWCGEGTRAHAPRGHWHHAPHAPHPPHLDTRTSAPWHSPRAASSPTRSPCPS